MSEHRGSRISATSRVLDRRRARAHTVVPLDRTISLDDLAVVHHVLPDAGRGSRSLWRRIVAGIIATDVLCALTATAAARAAGTSVPSIAIAAIVIGWVAAGGAFGLYAARLAPAIDEARRLVGATAIGVLLLVIATGPTARAGMLAAAAGVLAAFVARRSWRGVILRRRLDGRLAARTIIVGTGDDAADIAHILNRPGSGYIPLGFVATHGPLVSPNGLAIIGHLERLEAIARATDATCLFVAGSDATTGHIEAVARVAHRVGAELRVTTRMPAGRSSRVAMDTIDGALSVGLTPVAFGPVQAFAKRVLDLVVASILLVVASPAWLVIVALIRATSPGPAIFKQRRATQAGRAFTCLKFRTMVDDAESKVTGDARAMAFFKPRDDDRVTRIGRILRRTSLDELPQLLNVLRGDMSMVGPRPLPVEQVEANAERFAGRHDVRAGLTGWWQVNGRSDLDPDEAVRLDLFYIRNWSIALDLYIMWRTARAMLERRGAL